MEEEAPLVPKVRGRYITKRALKNKALAVSFDEKDLKDYVTGFHKRKKKRRKEAEKQQEEVLRRKRLENRKKRKLEKEFVLYGGAPPPTDLATEVNEEYCEEDEETEAVASVTGTTLYDNGNMEVTVTTSEISHEEENLPNETTPATVPRSVAAADKKHNIPVSQSKSFKKAAKHKSRPKPRSKRDKKKGKKKNQSRR
ncbi:hypothetical protein ACOSP7_012144 [Xanthoceras sorbifolium]